MGLQGAIGRSLDVPGVMTVIFTSTYTAIVGDFIARALNGEKPLLTGLAARQISALAAYLGGAAVAGAMTTLAAGRAFPSFNNGFDAARSITAVPDSFSDLIVLGLFLPYAPVF